MIMGQLKPNVQYIYEHADGITYAREFGSPTASRFEIGRTFERQQKDFNRQEDALWHDIRRAASDNKELQYALDRVKIIYELSRKDHG